MNCLEFRRQLAIEPRCTQADFVVHRAACARCAEAQQRALAFEQALGRALAVPAPAQLADQILLAQATVEQQRARRLRRNGLLALAASALLALGIGFESHASPLAKLAVKHLNKEAFVLGMSSPIADDDVRKEFAKNGVTLARVPAGVSFVYCCPVGEYHSVHLVMPETDGAVTVLYLTENAAATRLQTTQDGWQVRAVPLAHGTLVLLAHGTTQFDRVEADWRAALETSA